MGNCVAALWQRLRGAPYASLATSAAAAAATADDSLQLLGDVELQLAQAQGDLELAVQRQQALVVQIRALQPKAGPHDPLAVVRLMGLKHKLVGAMKQVRNIQALYIKMSTTHSGLETHTSNRRFLEMQQRFARVIGARRGEKETDADADAIGDDFQERVAEIAERTAELDAIIESFDAAPQNLDSLELAELLELCEGPRPAAAATAAQPYFSAAVASALMASVPPLQSAPPSPHYHPPQPLAPSIPVPSRPSSPQPPALARLPPPRSQSGASSALVDVV